MIWLPMIAALSAASGTGIVLAVDAYRRRRRECIPLDNCFRCGDPIRLRRTTSGARWVHIYALGIHDHLPRPRTGEHDDLP